MLEQDREAIMACASLAPSIHNTQPWLIDIRGNTVEVSVDPTRQLEWLDSDGRLARISCGAAAEFARLAARGAGISASLELADGSTDLVARILMGDREPASEVEQSLIDGMMIRYTDRGPYDDRPVPSTLQLSVEELTADHGTWLKVISGSEERLSVIQSLSDAEASEAADPGYRAELNAWLRDRTSPEGITAAALPAWPTTRVTDVPLRDFAGVARPTYPATGAPPAVERDALWLILTSSDGAADWPAAGRTLAVLTLFAATCGVTTQPLGPATDFVAARRRLRQRLGLVGFPQFLLRLGFGYGRPTTGRRTTLTV